jgi:glycosyltransferase involved in cell wall biosynthesis
MYREKSIALVIPARNEERLIGPTLDGVPPLIDRVYVVDDASPDGQAKVVAQRAEKDPRIVLLRHETNHGPGQGIITGYRQASQDGHAIVVVVGGDNQMDLAEVERFLDPIIEGRADYTKGNRFVLSRLEDTLSKMPKLRLVGNWIITCLTKVASGYYKAMDVVDGYTAITQETIDTVDWNRAWGGYGYPMDFLIRLNAYGFRCVEVPRTAIYLPGERQSQIKGLRYALKVSPMLARGFFWRLKFKYLYRDFHPLVLFYALGLLLIPTGTLFGLFLLADKLFLGGSAVTASRSVLVALLLISGIQFILFAMFFDMQASDQDGK